jgi:dolichol-phosphate mannosyltransferase
MVPCRTAIWSGRRAHGPEAVPVAARHVYRGHLAPTPDASKVGEAGATDQGEDPLTDSASAMTAHQPRPSTRAAWVVLPTYNEIENLPRIAAAILESLPDATLLIVDDNSPDGTGGLADSLAAADPRIRVRHRTAKQGLGPAYLDGFSVALAQGAAFVIQMDADFSHDPAALPSLLAPLRSGDADLVIGSRYTSGGRVENWSLGRRVISRGGSLFSRIVLGLRQQDLTGGFKAWRAATLSAIPFDGIHAGGYVFQIEMTYRASRGGARIREVPITFRDRVVGKSKMGRQIVVEALSVVVQLRLTELRHGAPVRRASGVQEPDPSRTEAQTP